VEVPEQPRVVAGRYALQSLIGEGGMASVWRARDQTLERPVAVKLLYARDERDKQRLVQQFLREARIAASVHHRNVISIVDFGSTEGQQPFMVMELLEGETLGARLHRSPPLPLAEALQIAVLTLRGLTAVHDAGIIHRDLKPDNVFLARDRSGGLYPKILDFGISRSMEPRSGRRSALTTRDGMIVGTPEYMSPEQARGLRELDRRCDIYSMGAILYQALTGRLAFSNENVGDLIIQIVTGLLKPVHVVNPSVPRAISDVVSKAMARLPADRYRDAGEMQQALMQAAQTALGPLAPSLSDMPPVLNLSHSGELRVDRPRTLEFPMDEGEGLESIQAAGASSPAAYTRPMVSAATVALPRPPRIPDEALRRPGLGRATWTAIAIATVMVGAALIVMLRSNSAWTPPAAPAVAREAPAAVPVPVEPQPIAINVELRGLPRAAEVSVDGAPAVGPTLELPRDGRNRVIRVTAAGKAPWQAVHHSSASASYDVFMVDSDPRPTRSAATSQRTSTASRAKANKRPPSALRRLDF
jgi:eukaryotic-like serine/threonine-protein kinase